MRRYYSRGHEYGLIIRYILSYYAVASVVSFLDLALLSLEYEPQWGNEYKMTSVLPVVHTTDGPIPKIESIHSKNYLTPVKY